MSKKLLRLLLLAILLNITICKVRRKKKKQKQVKTKSVKTKSVPRKTSDDDDDPPDVYCDLSVRPYPLLYYGQTKTIEFRLLFLSSCFDFPLLYYFTLPFNHSYNLFVHTHPTFVRLKLFGRLFDFKFQEGYER